jgi:hypothetical protein
MASDQSKERGSFPDSDPLDLFRLSFAMQNYGMGASSAPPEESVRVMGGPVRIDKTPICARPAGQPRTLSSTVELSLSQDATGQSQTSAANVRRGSSNVREGKEAPHAAGWERDGWGTGDGMDASLFSSSPSGGPGPLALIVADYRRF